MGGIGSDTAMETADVVLMSDDINQLTRTISISKKLKISLSKTYIFYHHKIDCIHSCISWAINTLVGSIK